MGERGIRQGSLHISHEYEESETVTHFDAVASVGLSATVSPNGKIAYSIRFRKAHADGNPSTYIISAQTVDRLAEMLPKFQQAVRGAASRVGMLAELHASKLEASGISKENDESDDNEEVYRWAR